MSGVRVRKPTEEMIPAVARLQQVAFAGYLNARLGERYQEAFIRWFFGDREAIALVALGDDERLLGYVVGAPLGYGAALNRAVLWPALIGIVTRPWLFLDRRFRRAVRGRLSILLGGNPAPAGAALQPEIPSPTISLVGIGVQPESRGQGVGLALMTAFEEQATARAARSLRLSVYPDNDAARRLYEKAGWRPTAEPDSNQAMYYYKLLEEVEVLS